MPGSTGQCLTGFIVSIIFAMFCLTMQPFLFRDDNILVATTQLCTSGTLLIALALKIDVLTTTSSAPLFISISIIPFRRHLLRPPKLHPPRPSAFACLGDP